MHQGQLASESQGHLHQQKKKGMGRSEKKWIFQWTHCSRVWPISEENFAICNLQFATEP